MTAHGDGFINGGSLVSSLAAAYRQPTVSASAQHRTISIKFNNFRLLREFLFKIENLVITLSEL